MLSLTLQELLGQLLGLSLAMVDHVQLPVQKTAIVSGGKGVTVVS